MKIFFDIIGCRLNQSEVENLANTFRALGHQIVADPADADLAIINTCTVTAKAAADSRKKLRRAARLGAKEVIATGCWATVNPRKALDLPGVASVFTNEEKEIIPNEILGISPEEMLKLNLIRKPLPGDRGRTRAFIKVQDGCDNYCTYCLTRIARGRSKSRDLVSIRRDIHAALDGGAQEIVLTGVQLGAWGKDFEKPAVLQDLLVNILSLDGFQRLRLSSIEPWDVDTAMLSLWQDRRLCRHFHVPLQSGDNRILRKMGRPITIEMYADLISEIRAYIPGVAITTDVITGFPGETETAFTNTREFIQRMRFSGGHVFTYSPRPNTAAVKMHDPVPPKIAKDRNGIVRILFKKLGDDYRQGFVGKTMPVLWESNTIKPNGTYLLSGLTDNYLRVHADSADPTWNQIADVRLITDLSKRSALFGEIINSA